VSSWKNVVGALHQFQLNAVLTQLMVCFDLMHSRALCFVISTQHKAIVPSLGDLQDYERCAILVKSVNDLSCEWLPANQVKWWPATSVYSWWDSSQLADIMCYMMHKTTVGIKLQSVSFTEPLLLLLLV